MASRQQKLSQETITTAIGTIEQVIATGTSELDDAQKLYDARRELLALSGGNGATEKPKRASRRRGLPSTADEATA